MTKICLVTQAHIAHNPRLVKEADALSAAGYSVRVVSRQVLPSITERDTRMMEGRSWRHEPIDKSGSWPAFTRRLHRKFFSGLASVGMRGGIGERALFEDYSGLLRGTESAATDLYIAHNLEALPVAYAAARKHGARLAFDSEDFHSGEFTADEANSLRKSVVDFVESKYLPYCDYVSAPSVEVADALARTYGIVRPLVVYNTFPWGDRVSLDGEGKDRRGDSLSLYWYSQTIGLDRGIQDVIRAGRLMHEPVQIHLRGNVAAAVKSELLALARECGMANHVFFHDTVPPGELLSRAAEHDVGLALENAETHSRILSVSNKMFLYMLAGLAVAATNVAGQRTILRASPGAGFLYEPGDHEELARQLQALATNRSSLLQTKEASLEAAKTRWNWEAESVKLVEKVASIITGATAERVQEDRSLYTSPAATS